MFNLLISLLIAGVPTPWTYAGYYTSHKACEAAGLAIAQTRPGVETYWMCVSTHTGQVAEPTPR